jgi:hypothetical protein
VKQSLLEPDPFRHKYRPALIETVATVVRSHQPATDGVVRSVATSLVPSSDLDRFVAMALSELEHMHEGNITRYPLRLSEYRTWKAAVQSLQR